MLTEQVGVVGAFKSSALILPFISDKSGFDWDITQSETKVYGLLMNDFTKGCYWNSSP